MLHSIATDLECKFESSEKKIVSLQSKWWTLADSLKTEKSKSRYAMEQLLIITTTQTYKLLASFQDRFTKLQRDKKTHNKQMSQLESEYQVSLTDLENQHNKKITSLTKSLAFLDNKMKVSLDNKRSKRQKLMTNEESKQKVLENEIHKLNEWVFELDNERLVAEKDRNEARANKRAALKNERAAQKKSMCTESKCKALESEVEGLNECLFELDNERKAAGKHHQSAKKRYMRAKSEAYLRLHKFREEHLARKEVEDNLLSVKKALCKTEQELEMACSTSKLVSLTSQVFCNKTYLLHLGQEK